jgi:diaminohydroxyphosphoribosylaminopyrimidine deaminase / 5-amino-6-(5-phosphoribosylamino)uracil reductase
MKIDFFYMSRCLSFAENFSIDARTNPKVGAILVYQDRIIGEGRHELFGSHHAEVNAIKSVKIEDEKYISQATIYITLEPCFHFGKTPPCVNLILEKKIPRVVIACQDPSEKVAGKSIKLLRSHGVEVVVGVMEAEAKAIIAPFLTNISKKRPYVILKYAESADGFLGRKNEPIWLTNSFSKHLVHRWRSEADAILVGKNTALIDDPQLTNRLFFGKNPLRVLIDKNLDVKTTQKLFDKNAKTIIFNQIKDEQVENITYKKLDFDENYLQNMLNILFEKNIGQIIIEGGAYTIQAFLEKNIWDEARVFKTKKVLNHGVFSPKIQSNFLEKTHQLIDNEIFIYKNK